MEGPQATPSESETSTLIHSRTSPARLPALVSFQPESLVNFRPVSTPSITVQTLQTSLQAKAKAEPAFRFYSLWDKVCRADVLRQAYRRCRANRGAPGVDGISFQQIETTGMDGWLEGLQQELRRGQYRPQPLLRVWIPKAEGQQRPLGIPTIRDRVVQMAMLLVMGPIFEEDLLPRQYGFRSGVDAKMAIRTSHFAIAQRGKREVVDADLSDYFNTIPHGELMRCISRRVADGTVLSVIRQWLKAPVVERRERGSDGARKPGTSARARKGELSHLQQ